MIHSFWAYEQVRTRMMDSQGKLTRGQQFAAGLGLFVRCALCHAALTCVVCVSVQWRVWRRRCSLCARWRR
jgi:hypothetical protein